MADDEGARTPARHMGAILTPDGATTPLDGLLAGLRMALDTGNAAEHRTALSGIADWPSVADLAAHHRVGTLFLQGLRNGSVRLPDPEARRTLALRRQRDIVRGMRQLDVMRQLYAGLTARGIPSLILKGLPLGQRLYGSPFAKTSIDIDLLVPDDAVGAAGHVLRERGYRRTMPDFRETPARMLWYNSVQKEHVYMGSGAKIELHRRLLGNRFLFNPSFGSLHASAATVEVGPHRFQTLGDTDQLLYLTCHGSLHYWQRLKWLCDVAALVRTMDDTAFELALARSREARLDGLVAPALLLCRTALHVEKPTSATTHRMRGSRVQFVASLSRRAWTPRGGLRQILRKAMARIGRVFIGTGVRYGLHEARGLLIRHHHFSRVDLPDRLFWVYALARPVLWALRVPRKA